MLLFVPKSVYHKNVREFHLNKGNRDNKTPSAAQRWASCKEWLRLRSRRFLYRLHIAASSTIALTPTTYLAVAAALGIALTVSTMYSTSYAVTVDGEYVGRVAEQETVEKAIKTVETQGTRMLGTDFQVEGDVDYQFALTLKSDLNSQRDMEDFFYDQLDAVSTELRMYEVSVDGESMGIVKNYEMLNEVLSGIKQQFMNENTISADFVENLRVESVYTADVVSTVGEVQERLAENTTGETTYTVQSGDTFNAIAHANDMAISELQALNPDVNINRLQVGDVLNVKEYIPKLSVRTVEDQTYHQAIECPVVKVDDSTMYKGDTKVLVQGEEGDALINATVTYVNGKEQERQINSSTTLKEPTTTTMAVGTKEKPKTASKGYFIWPASGRINSYFGGRYIFGSYSTTAASTSRCPTVRPLRPPTAAPSPSPAGRVLTAIWSSSSTTTGCRPITPTTPPCWSAPARRSIRARPSQRAAPPAAPPATTATLRSASTAPPSTR